MAIIRLEQRNRRISTLDPNAINRAGRVGQEIVGAVSAFAQRQQRINDATAKSEVALGNAKAEAEYENAFRNMQNQFASDPVKATDEFNKALTNADNNISQSFTTETSMGMYGQSSEFLKIKYRQKLSNWQEVQTGTNIFNNISDALDNFSVQAESAGESGDINKLQEIMDTSGDTIVAGQAALSADNVRTLNKSRIDKLSNAYILGGIRTRPDETIEELERGDYDNFIDAEQKLNYLKQANVSAKKQEDASDALLNEFKERVYEETFSRIVTGGVNAPTEQDIVDLLNNGGIDIDDFNKLISQINKPKSTRNDLGKFLDMNSQLVNGNLSNREISEAFANGQINQETAQRFIQYNTSNAKNNPAVIREVERLRALYPVNPVYGFRTEEEQKILADAEQQMIDAVITGDKSPRQVYDDIVNTLETTQKETAKNIAQSQIMKQLGNDYDISDIEELEDKLIEQLGNSTSDRSRNLYKNRIESLKEIKDQLQNIAR